MKLNPAALLAILLAVGGVVAVILADRNGEPPAVPMKATPVTVAPPAAPQTPTPAPAPPPAAEPAPLPVVAEPTSPPAAPMFERAPTLPAFPPNGSQDGSTAHLSNNVEELKKQIVLLEGQIEYLQGQNDALKDENAQMLQKLGTLGMKDTPQVSMKDDGAAPDFVGMGLEMMKMRKLQALPMITTAVSQEEVETVILGWLKRQQPEEEARKLTRGLAALGWIPESIDPLPMRAALLARVLGGWYDDESETMMTVDPATASAPSVAANEPLAIAYGQLLREYGSTLFQPQYGPLSTDMRMARESLIAGDAGLTRFLHSLQNPISAPKDDLPAEDPDHPLNQVALPVFLKELALFPFSRGFEFAQTLHSAGNFPQLNAAYSRPPISTAEVIEPEIYLDAERAPPVEMQLAEVKLAGVAPFLDDRLGKFACVTSLRIYNKDEVAAEGARGLLSDRLLAWPAEGAGEAKRDNAAWQTLFVDKASADAFHKAMLNVLTQRYNTKGEAEFTAKGRFVSLSRNRGDAGVVLIDAATEQARAAMKLLMNQ